MNNEKNNKVKARLKKMYTCLTLSSITAVLSAGALGFGVYELSNEKEYFGISAVLASLIGAAAAVKLGQKAAHHKRVYKSIRPIKEPKQNTEVGVEKTLSSQNKKVLFFSSKKELKAYRKEKRRREKEAAKKNNEMTK